METTAEDEEREVMIYDAIGDYGISAKDFIKDLKAMSPAPKLLRMRINSPGGSVFDGNAIYNELVAMGAGGMKIEAVIDGIAASMASIIAMAADKITMPSNAVLFIHNPYTLSMGDADALRKDADLLDKLKKEAVKAYKRHAKDLTDEEISEIMDEDTWMTADEAKEWGFAEEVTEAQEIDESAIAKMKNVPKGVYETIRKFKAEVPPVPTVPQMSIQPTPSTKGVNMKFDALGNLIDDKGAIVMTAAQIKAGTPADVELVKAHKREIDEAVAAAAAAENKRITDITKMCSDGGFPEMATDLAKPGVTVEQAQKALLDKVIAAFKPTGTRVVADETDKARAGMVNALLVAGHVETSPEKVAEVEKSEFKPIRGLQSLVKEIAQRAGMKDVHRFGPAECGQAFLELMGISQPRMGLGMNTNDLYSVLSSTAEISLLKGLREAPSTYQAVSSPGTLPDLKSNEMYKNSEAPDVLEIPEGQAPQLSVVSDKYETAKLKKMGRAYSVTEQMVINDRLDIISSLPEKYGRAITREINYDFWATLLTGNGPTLLETGRALFNNTDGNQAAAGSAMTEATLDAGFVAVTGYALLSPDGNRSRTQTLSIAPRRLVTGFRSRMLANRYCGSTYSPDAAVANIPNPFGPGSQTPLTPVVEVLIDTLIPATDAWLLALDPADIDYAKILTLAGRPSPRTTSKVTGAGEAKGFVFDIEHYWKVALVDWRGWYKNVGV
jgi:ATP-dependent protease ClpP protease subunit